MERDRLAFTSGQATRLAGITKRQLDYWIATDLLSPEVSRGEGRGRVRLFSFGNLVELRAAAWMREWVSLQLIRKVVHRLRREGYDRPLEDVAFGVVRSGRADFKVVLRRADGAWEHSIGGQLVIEGVLPIAEFVRSIEDGIREGERRQATAGKIERRRGALGSRRLIAGTRVPTSAVWHLHEAGRTADEIIKSYPGLTGKDVDAALRAERKDRRSA